MAGRDWRDFIIASVVALLAFFIPAGIAWANAMQVPTIGVEQWQKTTVPAMHAGAHAQSNQKRPEKHSLTCAGNGYLQVSITSTYAVAADGRSNERQNPSTLIRQTTVITYTCQRQGQRHHRNMAVLLRTYGKAG